MNVSDFIYYSKELSDVKELYAKPYDFLKYYSNLDSIAKKSLVYHYIMDNNPYAFIDIYEKPLLFEQIKQYISYILEVDFDHIKIIGSTKTGFCMGKDDYGRPYSKERDLDFMIIDKSLFEVLSNEFKVWKEKYLIKAELLPNNDREKSYWDDNIKRIPSTINHGFIDTCKMPNRQNYLPVNSKVNNTMYLIVRRLGSEYDFHTKKASMRVYKDIDSFYCQQVRNIDAIIMSKR